MAKVTDDWETLESSANRSRQEGLYVSVAPSGRVAFLGFGKLLDPKLTQCEVEYSPSRQMVRLTMRREATNESYTVRVAKGEGAYFCPKAPLRSRGLLPDKLTRYAAMVEKRDGTQLVVSIDLSEPLAVIEPHYNHRP